MDEFLVILAEHATPEQRRAITGMLELLQSISERVFIARGGEAAHGSLAVQRGVELVLRPGQTSAKLPKLSDSEDLFARGWLARQGMKKQRIGEGLDWDTPPMTPPAREKS
jgi:hypothetical protein